jgi:hypothetical protein
MSTARVQLPASTTATPRTLVLRDAAGLIDDLGPINASISTLNTSLAALTANLGDHVADDANPHGVTPAQIGAAGTSHTHSIGDVTALQTALDARLLLAGGTLSGALNFSGNNASNLGTLTLASGDTLTRNRKSWSRTLTARTGVVSQAEVARLTIPANALAVGDMLVCLLVGETTGGVGAQSGSWATVMGVTQGVIKQDSTGSFFSLAGGDGGYAQYQNLYLIWRTGTSQIMVCNIPNSMRATFNTYNPAASMDFYLNISIGTNATTNLTYTPRELHVQHLRGVV